MVFCEVAEDKTALSWPLVGWFKMKGGVAGCHMIPISGRTNDGIMMFTWTQRFLMVLSHTGYEKGGAFSRSAPKSFK